MLNEDEEADLLARSAEAGVTPSRFLFEFSMSTKREVPAMRKRVLSEFFLMRRVMANHANNTNQIAKLANAEKRFPDEANDIYRDYKRIVGQLNSILERLEKA